MNFLIGITAGIFGGLAGLGGGVIMIPLMIFAHRLPQKSAHGTSLVVLVFTGLTGAATYALKGYVDLEAAFFLAVTAVFAARSGAHYCHALPDATLRRYFGIFLLIVAALLVSKPYLNLEPCAAQGWIRIAVLLGIGLFSGFLSGLMGVGGGSIMVPAMVLLLGMSQHTAQGSSLLTMVPAGAAGALTHHRLGNVRKSLLPGLITGIILGTFVGGTAAGLIPDGPLRAIFAAVLVWTGFNFLKTAEPAEC
jgi:uncharacterized protein